MHDGELWIRAQLLVNQFGPRAPAHIERQITDQEQAGDEEGVKTWLAIAERVEQLIDFKGSGRTRH